MTGDRDALQLVSSKTKVMLTRKGITEVELFDEGKVWDKFGVTPAQIIELKALQGDQSDNIPGVPKVGEKTALALIKSHGSVEEIVNNLDQVIPKYQKLIRGNEEMALLSKKLATIVRDVPMELDLSLCSWRGPDNQKLLELFQELEFKTLIRQLTSSVSQVKQKSKEKQKNEIDLPPLETYQVGYKTIAGQETLDDLLVAASHAREIGIYLEGDRREGIKCAYLAIPDKDIYLLFPEKVDESQGIPQLSVLKALCENKDIKKFFHDAKAAIWLLHKHNICLNNLAFDTMLASYLINPTASDYELYDIALDQLGIVLPTKGEAASAARADAILRLSEVLLNKLAQRRRPPLS
ncbi:hypothetical protein N752_01715 [Desulforamulus aquiferis]|nr:hypothetical protein N752_01715 [Desulforamulus aquiferis]